MGQNVQAQLKNSSYAEAVIKYIHFFIDKIYLFFLSLSALVFKRMKYPWLRYDFIFNLTQSGKDHGRYLKCVHDFTRKVKL